MTLSRTFLAPSLCALAVGLSPALTAQSVDAA